MVQQSISGLLDDLAVIERLIEQAEFRAQDAAAATDKGAVKRIALELSQLKLVLAELKADLSDRTVGV